MSTESPILKAWESARSWMDGRDYRDRVLIAVSLCAVLALVWYMLLLGPALQKQAAVKVQLSKIKTDVIQLDSKKAQTLGELSKDPNVRLREQIARLQGLSESLNNQIDGMSASWITPAAMANALRSILSERGKLRLVSLTSDAPKELKSQQAAIPQPAGGQSGANVERTVFVHGMEIVVEGDFFAVVDYLQAVESSPWQFYWNLLDYEVGEYPNAKVTLRVQTYSAERGWIGV